jgi:tRNA 2-thiouridine synthesizing protein A
MRTVEYDLTGLMCPIPIIKANRKLSELESGDLLIAAVTDPIAKYDFPDFCKSTGHQLVGVEKDGDRFFFSIRCR